jgi:N-acyl-phosphatidylethanolamine-hydrolysing phospholipase D
LRLTATTAQHFSGRSLNNRNQTLWCGWTFRSKYKAIWFVGDTGRHPVFEEIGRRLGPFDAILMPIGAYDPEWFMGPVHINPENAVAAYMETTAASANGGDAAVMTGMHWGTFKLTDEPMDEPPARARRAWTSAGLAESRLWIPRHGETRVF